MTTPNPGPAAGSAATALATYQARFTRLNRNTYQGHGAPYKPALLLAVLAGIETGAITHNRITFSPELITSFRATCTALNTSPHHRDNQMALPFYHLATEKQPFWFLQSRPGKLLQQSASHSVFSFRNLREAVAYASLSPDLWALLQDPLARETLRHTLLTHYFPTTHARYHLTAGQEELATIEWQMLHEPAAAYVAHARATATEELEAVRSSLFKRVVLAAYHHTCAISGLQLTSTAAASAPLLDACHIVPWALSYDDTLPNGLALCPNLHRAFDRHLFAIDEDYRVRCADSFTEAGNAGYGVRQFEGKQLRLPKERAKWPGVENFRKRAI